MVSGFIKGLFARERAPHPRMEDGADKADSKVGIGARVNNAARPA